jgi:hypothetical protein
VSHSRLASLLVLIGLGLVAPINPAVAGDRGPIDQDVQISLGGFFMSFDTDVRLDGETTGNGTEINWEDEFEFDDENRFRLDAFWRFAEKHKVRLMYFENNRSNSTTLTRDIDFGDTTFPVNLDVDSRLDTRIIELAYEYAFLQREDLEVSGSVGIHNIRVEAGLRGEIVGPGGGAAVDTVEVAEGDGPLPVLGVRVLWQIGGDFYLDGLAQFFFAEIDNYDGNLQDYKLGVTWFPFRNVGFGVAYNEFVTRLDVEKEAFTGRLKLKYGGPMAFFTVGF